MNQIPAVPNQVTQAGLSFNYALWTAGTRVTLSNVPWDADYRNVVNFPTEGGLDAYLDSQETNITVSQMKHLRLNQDIRIDVPFEHVVLRNYIRAHNPAQPVATSLPSTYYYFITDVLYTAPNTTTIRVQLDVWATFFPKIQIGRSYIERSHIGIANSNQEQQSGRRYLTVPEGMDIGGEMEIAKSWVHKIASAREVEDGKPNFSIMVTATTDFSKIGPPSDDTPRITTSSGSKMENLPNGTSIYFFRRTHDLNVFLNVHGDRPWVTQAITGIVVIPDIGTLGMALEEVDIPGVAVNGAILKAPDDGNTIPPKNITLTSDWTTGLGIPTRYKNLHKFKVSPYAMIEVTSFSGQPLMMKPESLSTRSLDMTLLTHLSPGSAKMTFAPRNYNAGSNVNIDTAYGSQIGDSGEWMDFASTITSFPTFTTVNNSQASYMAQNKNQIAFEYKNATWDQQRAMAGASTAYGNAQNSMKTGLDQAQVGMNQIGQTANQNNQTETGRAIVGGTQAAMGGFSQAAGGNPVGGLINGVTGVGASYANMQINQSQNTAMSGINQMAMGKNANLQAGNQDFVSDANKGLADSVARGDYANAIAGIQAKVQDAAALQPTTSGQIGGDAFNLATTGWMIMARLKRLQGVGVAEVGEYWLRYGYRINRWVYPPQDLHVCEKFSYWQMQDAAVFTYGCPESYRQTIRGILEKGVTVWKNPDDIGWLDPADNDPLEGIAY